MSIEVELKELQQQLYTARGSLRDVDEDIHKLPTRGRGLIANRGRGRGGPGRIFRAAMGFQGRGMRGTIRDGQQFQRDSYGQPFQRDSYGRNGQPFQRDSFGRDGQQFQRDSLQFNDFDDDSTDQSLLKSEVVAKDPSQTREEALRERSKELKKFSGSKRLFQVGLLGTLSKFREENKANEKQVRKEKEVEQKLAAAAQKEIDDLENARRQLMFKRRARQMEVQKIERKMFLIRMQDEWEKRNKQYMSFIQTNSKPPIFWIPKIPTEKSFEMHKKSNARLEKMVTRHKKTLEEQINRIDYDRSVSDDHEKKVVTENELGEIDDADMDEEEVDEPRTKRLKSAISSENTFDETVKVAENIAATDIDAEIGKDVALTFDIGLDCETEKLDEQTIVQDTNDATLEKSEVAKADPENQNQLPGEQENTTTVAGENVALEDVRLVGDLSDIPLPGQVEGTDTPMDTNQTAAE